MIKFQGPKHKKHPKMQKNINIYQLVITNILIGMKQCIHVATLNLIENMI